MSIDDKTNNVDNNPEVANSQSLAQVQQEEPVAHAEVPKDEPKSQKEESEQEESETGDLQEIQDMLTQQKQEMQEDPKEEDIGAGDISSIIMEPLDEEE